MSVPSLITLLLAASLTGGLEHATLPIDSDALPPAARDTDFRNGGRPDAQQVELGRFLFFDKLLSGNRNISCATCHHPQFVSGDGVALPFGEGARGLGTERRPGASPEASVYGRVPRNSPALFNLGASEFTRLFHDGRVEEDPEGHYEGGFITPAKFKLPTGLADVLAAQAMFPVSSPLEMAGQKSENPLADAVALNNVGGRGGLWEQVADRLRTTPEYVELFQRAFPAVVAGPEDVTYVLAANAIAAFEAEAFRADDSPFDRHLRVERQLTGSARRGMELFYGKANCSSCHSGTFQTDHEFHSIAMPQIGPGKSDGYDSSYWSSTGLKAFVEDFGRGRVTVRPEDRYAFRTPSLRNVELTGPWGHDGAYDSLEGVVRHHLDPVAALHAYRVPEGLLPEVPSLLEQTARGSRLATAPMSDSRRSRHQQRDTWVQRSDALRDALADSNELAPSDLSDAQVDDLLAFLRSLTDPSSRDLSRLVPERVPSGLPVMD